MPLDKSLTVNELLKELWQQPVLLAGGRLIEIMESFEERPPLDLSKEIREMLREDEEFRMEEIQFLCEIQRELAQGTETKQEAKGNTDSDDFYALAPEEILEKLRCKCKNFKDKYLSKALLKQKGTDTTLHGSTKDSETQDSKVGERDSDVDRRDIGGEENVESSAPPPLACKQYLSVKDYAIFFIDDLLEEAEEKVNILPYSVSAPRAFIGEDAEQDDDSEEQSEEEVQTVPLGSTRSELVIENFTPKGGRALIVDTIRTWNMKKNWNYCINFISEDSDSCSDFYIFEVIWSLPTMSYPIPQVTATVFFKIECSRVKPKECPVTVTYNFESERYKFSLYDDIQHETFLDNILKSKLDFFRSLRM